MRRDPTRREAALEQGGEAAGKGGRREVRSASINVLNVLPPAGLFPLWSLAQYFHDCQRLDYRPQVRERNRE